MSDQPEQQPLDPTPAVPSESPQDPPILPEPNPIFDPVRVRPRGVYVPFEAPYIARRYGLSPFDVAPRRFFGWERAADPPAFFADPLAGRAFDELASEHSRQIYPIPMELRINDSRYEFRAEIPGVDPAHDIRIVIKDGFLNIEAQRKQDMAAIGQSEFPYGRLARSIRLPVNADLDTVVAKYENGILTISSAISMISSSPEQFNIYIEKS